MRNKAKGEWGYINSQRIRVMLITLVLYVCAIGLYLIGYLTLHTNRSIWSILAVLSLLPASKSMVNLIMFLRFRSLDPTAYENYVLANGEAPALYEVPFTTYEKTYFVDTLMCRNNTVIVCYLGKGSKKVSHDKDMNNLNHHLTSVLKNDGHKDFTVKIFDNVRDYCKRAEDINKNMEVKDEDRDLSLRGSLKSVTL